MLRLGTCTSRVSASFSPFSCTCSASGDASPSILSLGCSSGELGGGVCLAASSSWRFRSSSSCRRFSSFNSKVVSLSKAPNLSSCAAADFSKASCFLIRFSTSSIVCPSSWLMRYGSCAISHASATAASRANWYTSRMSCKFSQRSSQRCSSELRW